MPAAFDFGPVGESAYIDGGALDEVGYGLVPLEGRSALARPRLTAGLIRRHSPLPEEISIIGCEAANGTYYQL